MIRFLVAVLMLVGCSKHELPGRQTYNEAQDLAGQGAIDSYLKSLSDAPNTDGTLLFEARYGAGVGYSELADEKSQETPKEAMALLEKASGYFALAEEVKPGEGAKEMQQAAIKKLLVLAAKLDGPSELTKMIDELRKKQRELRMQLAMMAKESKVGERRLDDFAKGMALQQRLLTSSAGEVWDFAQTQKSAAEQVTDENAEKKKIEAAQIGQAMNHLEQARQHMWKHRSRLRKRDLQASFVSSSESIDSLSQALETLLPPATRIRLLMADQELVIAEVLGFEAAAISEGTVGVVQSQKMLTKRTEHFTLLLAAASGGEGVEAKQLLAAEPFVKNAHSEMKQAESKIESDSKSATTHQRQAIIFLAMALEELADLKTLIEITAKSHEGNNASMILSKRDDKAIGETLKKDIERLTKMTDLIQHEKEASQKNAQEGQESKDELYDEAERLRALAFDSLVKTTSLAGDSKLSESDAANEKLQELRLLFAGIVEHLKVLAKQQAKVTDDLVSEIQEFSTLNSRQQQLSQKGEGLASALEKMSEQAQVKVAEQKKYTDAAEEVRLGVGDMLDSSDALADADSKSQQMSVDRSPIAASQQQAIEHIEAAIRILTPPKSDDNKQDSSSKDDKQQQEKQNKQQQENKNGAADKQVQRQQAERQRQRQTQGSQDLGTDKDW